MSKTVNKVREAKLSLYRTKGKIYAKATKGRFSSLRWIMVFITQTIFYGMCWLTWQSNDPTMVSRQAILLDITHEKFYFFGLTLWPQDALLMAFALVIGATGLFFVTALAGRLFCGFVCPQTIYTEIFMWVEARIEGDHLARMKLDQTPWTARKLALRLAKHSIWAAIAIWTGITFVGYFVPIRDVLSHVQGWQFGPWEGFWLIFYSLFTYIQAGLAREAVCQHMCPYSRFQGVMFDPQTRSVSYDKHRGEPRQAASLVRSSDHKGVEAAGDCIDCGICVQVCPTGVDIRDGSQYQCINCGICIDACDDVMKKVGKPISLIRFASEAELAAPPAHVTNTARQAVLPPWQRPRLMLYAVLLLIFSVSGAWRLTHRQTLLVDVIRDRGALFRENNDGQIENAYTLKIMNLAETPRQLTIAAEGVDGLKVSAGPNLLVAAGSITPIPLTLAAPMAEAEGKTARKQKIVFHIGATAKDGSSAHAEEKSIFIMP